MSQNMLARLKPYNLRRGHLLRRLTIDRARFDGTKGWYRVKASLAGVLRKIKQPPAPGSMNEGNEPGAFDIARDEAEARQIEQEAKKLARRRAPRDANDLTSVDLTGRDSSDSEEANERAAETQAALEEAEEAKAELVLENRRAKSEAKKQAKRIKELETREAARATAEAAEAEKQARARSEEQEAIAADAAAADAAKEAVASVDDGPALD